MRLNFKLDSTEEIWEEVINIFTDRINSRIIYGIDKLIANKNKYEITTFIILTGKIKDIIP